MNQLYPNPNNLNQLPSIQSVYKSPLDRMMDNEDGIVPRAMKTTVGKIVVIGGGVVFLLLVSGALFRVLAYTVGGWNELKRASEE